MQRVLTLLQELDLPTGDRYDHPTSSSTFPDGTHSRVEIPIPPPANTFTAPR